VSGLLLVNPRSGDDPPSTDELVRAARKRGIKTYVMRENEDPHERARQADADTLGVAGGVYRLHPFELGARDRLDEGLL